MLVFGKKIKFEIVDGLAKAHGVYAWFIPDKWKIQIDKKAHEGNHDEFVATIIHEFCHTVFLRCGLKQAVGHDLEEVIIENISRALVENFSIKPKKNIDQ